MTRVLKILFIFFIHVTFNCHCNGDLTSDEDEQLLFDLGQLYKEPHYELDPNDMLSPRVKHSKLSNSLNKENIG